MKCLAARSVEVACFVPFGLISTITPSSNSTRSSSLKIPAAIICSYSDVVSRRRLGCHSVNGCARLPAGGICLASISVVRRSILLATYKAHRPRGLHKLGIVDVMARFFLHHDRLDVLDYLLAGRAAANTITQ